MNRYIGIVKEKDDRWYTIGILLYNRLLKLTLYTPRFKRPKYYYYDRESFTHLVDDENSFGLHIK